MRVMFYQISRDPAHALVPLLARKSLEAGERVLVVSADKDQTAAISRALWSAAPDSFLANGEAGDAHAERQPVLLSDEPEARNGARFMILADGQWREGDFERTFYLFDEATISQAREVWRSLRERQGLEMEYWAQENGRWSRKATN